MKSLSLRLQHWIKSLLLSRQDNSLLCDGLAIDESTSHYLILPHRQEFCSFISESSTEVSSLSGCLASLR